MKSPGVIYRRYRQFKRKLLYDKIVLSRQITHDNCIYGKKIDIKDTDHSCDVTIKTCLFGFSNSSTLENIVELCTCPKECNAFASKWTKEKIVNKFESELLDWETKNRMYPELLALEWVLDKDLLEASKSPGIIANIVISLIYFLEKALKYISYIQIKVKETK